MLAPEVAEAAGVSGFGAGAGIMSVTGWDEMQWTGWSKSPARRVIS